MTYHTQNKRVALSNLVSKQLPEFVRAQYPTFVAFVEAYYEHLDKNSVDLTQIRDIDTTLDEFIQHFKSELAHNYPISDSYDTERYLLKHVRDQYLAKGSEASYKLLFRLLFSKDVYLDYPGKQMLRVSDGRWTQDVSLFIRVDLGDPISLIGKIVDIQTSKRINRDKAISKLTANVENVIKVAGTANIYEIFLDRKFYGDIQPGDVIKYQSVFQGQILPCTAKIRIQNKGKKFRPGQVFQIQFGEGSALWFKVLTTDADGGLEKVDLIKFGIGYNTDFSIELLPTSAVSTKKKNATGAVAITFYLTAGVIGGIEILNSGDRYQQPPEVRFSDEGSGAVAHTVIDQNGKIVDIILDEVGSGYTTESFATIVPVAGDLTGAGGKAEIILGSIYEYDYLDHTDGFTENGYLDWGDYWDVSESGTGAKATCSISNNVIKRINVTNIGSNYTEPPIVNISGTGSGASAHSIIQDGVVNSIIIGTQGSNYKKPPKVVFDDPTGSGASAHTVITGGKVTSIVLDSRGSDYSDIAVTIVPAEGDDTGSGATATVQLVDGAVTSIVMDTFGYNYSTVNVALTRVYSDNTGSGATAEAITIDGGVSNITLTNGGSGYLYPSPTIDICTPLDENGVPIGGATKAEAKAVVKSGVLSNITITNSGLEYTEASINIAEPFTANVWEIGREVVVGEYVRHTSFGATNYWLVESGTALGNTPPNKTSPKSTEYNGNCVLAYVGTQAKAQATITPSGRVIGAIITVPGSGYSNSPLITIDGDGTGATATSSILNGVITGIALTNPGEGYSLVASKAPPISIVGAYGYANGAYVGSIARQFYIDAKDTVSTNQALLNVSLDAVAKYPGYYKTNDGFLNDSMFIQDSYYYQAFSYVIRIDEQLQSYAAVVRTMLHPSGMAMFGEYSINNNINLQVALDSLVKSLGITLLDLVNVNDDYELDENGIVIRGNAIKTTKDLSSSNIVLDDETLYDNDNRLLKGLAWNFTKYSEDSITNSDVTNFKPFYDNILMRNVFGIEKVFGFVGSAEKVFMYDDGSVKRFTKTLTDTTSLTENYTRKFFSKTTNDFQPTADQHAIAFTLNTILDPLSGEYPQFGYLIKDPYEQGSYALEEYVNTRETTFSS